MISNWNIIYYEDEKENTEVFNFIDSQKVSNKVKILSWLSMLEEKEIRKAKKCRDYFLKQYSEKKLRKELDENL